MARSTRPAASIIAVTFWKGVGAILSVASAVGMANIFGATASTDAYFLARRLITNVGAVMERSAHLLFVPQFVRIARHAGIDAIRDRVRGGERNALAVSIAVCAALIIFAEPIVSVLAPGFGAQTRADAALFFRIIVLTLPVVVITALTGAVLNSMRVYSLPAVARLLPRMFVLLALLTVPVSLGLVYLSAALVAGTLAMGIVFAVGVRRVFRQARDAGPMYGEVAQARGGESPRRLCRARRCGCWRWSWRRFTSSRPRRSTSPRSRRRAARRLAREVDDACGHVRVDAIARFANDVLPTRVVLI
nr:hypothetical protein [Paracoccaceae bacterium]